MAASLNFWYFLNLFHSLIQIFFFSLPIEVMTPFVIDEIPVSYLSIIASRDGAVQRTHAKALTALALR